MSGIATSMAYKLIIGLVQFVIGIGISTAAIFYGLRILDIMTAGINEWKEIQKGNVAVGIVVVAIIYSIAFVVQTGVMNFMNGVSPELLTPGMEEKLIIAVLVGVANLLLWLFSAIISLGIAVSVIKHATLGLKVNEELKSGNVAVALYTAGVLFAISFMVKAAVEGISNAINIVDIALLLGL